MLRRVYVNVYDAPACKLCCRITKLGDADDVNSADEVGDMSSAADDGSDT
jgi:hypothetical protein